MQRSLLILHGKGGSPEGSSKQLQECLEQLRPEFRGLITRPRLLHSDPNVLADESLADLRGRDLPQGAILIGISLGGLLAAKLQESGRADLHVVAISSPTWADGVRLGVPVANRISLYSSGDEVIAGRTSEWPRLGSAYDLPWLTHDTDRHKEALARLVLEQLGKRKLL